MRFLACLCIALCATACLSDSHRIPNQELAQITSRVPAERGKRVRVIQQFSTHDPAPPAPGVNVSAGIVISTPVARRVPARNAAKLAARDGKFWRIIAAITAVGLAFTEGMRYDGWVELHPMHPVHLFYSDGGYRWVPLAQLDAAELPYIRGAYVRPYEGPFRRLGRAPLNRVGFTYGFLFGRAVIPTSDNLEFAAPTSHIQIGFHPAQELGILLNFQAGWTDDQNGDTIFDTRTSLELQGFPASAGRLHLGLFGGLGLATRLDDGAGSDRSGLALSGGGLVQLELTTRLTITGRAGVARVYGELVPDFTVGLSIY